MKNSVMLIFVCLAVAWGCARQSTVDQQSSPSPSTESASPTSDTGLPKSFGPLDQHERGVQLVKEAFIILPLLRSVDSFTVKHERELARTAYLYATVETLCTLEKIKGYVASGLSPVVIIKSTVKQKHAYAVIGYDDSIERLIVTDPVSYGLIKINYDNFLKSWTDHQKTCLLVLRNYSRGEISSVKPYLLRYKKAKRSAKE
jgi:hypothetical protein